MSATMPDDTSRRSWERLALLEGSGDMIWIKPNSGHLDRDRLLIRLHSPKEHETN